MTLTPEQFNKLATKEDLKELEEKCVTKDEFNKRMDEVITVIDGLAKNVNDFQVEMRSNQAAHDRLDEKIENHEVRIKSLEATA